MRDYEELVKRLRDAARFSESRGYSGMANTTEEAADAIEELTRENKEISFRAAQLEAMNDALIGETGAADALMVASKPRWIPVTERLPDAESGDVSAQVLVTDGECEALAELFNFETCGPYWSYTGIGEITHWRPLPKPPKEDT